MKRDVEPRRPADFIMLLAREAEAQKVGPLAITPSLDDLVDTLLIARIDCVERFAAVIEIELVVRRVGKRRGEISLEGAGDDFIFLVAY